MKKLSEVEKETLLIRVLSQGRGSVEYARDLLTGANDPESEPPEPENDIEPWCICGVCRRMQDEQENVCCQKRTCVTSYVMFNTTCSSSKWQLHGLSPFIGALKQSAFCAYFLTKLVFSQDSKKILSCCSFKAHR